MTVQTRDAASKSPTPADLAELMSAFNDVTARLESTHESLRREVARLQRELREANEQLQRSRRLAALGEMAAGIAHEVRNPLASIGLYARMLGEDLAGRERELALKIGTAVRGLDAVVGDVLAFAREVRVRPAPAQAQELFSRALHACAAMLRPGVAVCRADQSRRPLRLECDPALVQQALVNIIRNALEAMREAPPPHRGHVLTLDARRLADAGRAMAALSVSDTGPGVSDDVVDRMFNPFFTTRQTGTGLGLAIVHRIVDAHGGRMVVRNAERGGRAESGAQFEVLIPSGPAIVGRGGEADAPRRSRQGCRAAKAGGSA